MRISARQIARALTFRKKPHLVAVVGAMLGDEGKGGTVDFLAQRLNAQQVIRVGSGPNAGHNVVEPFGRIHTFQQIPSGAFKRNPKTGAYDALLVLSGGEMVDPGRVAGEIDALEELGHHHVLGRLKISPRAGMVLGYHVVLNRMKEISEGRTHGSTGRGNNQSLEDKGKPNSITMADLLNLDGLGEKLEYWVGRKKKLAQWYIDTAIDGNRAATHRMYQSNLLAFNVKHLYQSLAFTAGRIGHRIIIEAGGLQRGEAGVLEFAQGINLHPKFGTVPNTTPYHNIMLTAEALRNGTTYKIEDIKDLVLVTRAYTTSHGPRFMPTEIDALSGKLAVLQEYGDNPNVIDGVWNLNFRVGWLDIPMLRNGVYQQTQHVDPRIVSFAVSSLDRFHGFDAVPICDYYIYNGHVQDLIDAGIAGYEHKTDPRTGEERLAISRFQAAISASPKIRKNITPHYIEVAPGNIVKTIEDLTGVPVSITSHGPARQDTRFTSKGWEKRLSRRA